MILFTLFACTAVVEFPPPQVWDSGTWGDTTGTTGTTSEPRDTGVRWFQPVQWDASCDESGWTYRLRVEGWVGGATLDVIETGGARERHSLGITASDPSGSWDELGLGPLPVVVRPEQVAGTSTAFACDAPLSMVVRIEDAEGQLLSCAVAGDDPAAALAEVRNAEPALQSLGGCTVF